MNAEGGKGGAVPAIEVEGLSFSYPGGTRVLDGLAWEVPAGAFMLLVEGVQIFQGVETLQSMELEPLNEGQSSLIQNNVREITGQTL